MPGKEGFLSSLIGAVGNASPAGKAVQAGSTIVYIVLMLLAIIFIAIGIGLLGSWNIMSGMILLLVGGGLGFVGYTMNKPAAAGAGESYYGGDDDWELGDDDE
jgi:hypothetical protein